MLCAVIMRCAGTFQVWIPCTYHCCAFTSFSEQVIPVLSVSPCLCNSFFTASFRSHARMKELLDFKDVGNERSQQFASKQDAGLDQNFQLEENSSSSPDSSRSFGDTQLEIFHHRHGLLILHLLAALMFVPSFVAWLQVWITCSFLYWPWVLNVSLLQWISLTICFAFLRWHTANITHRSGNSSWDIILWPL